MKLATWNLEHFYPVPGEPLLIRKNGDATRLRDIRLIERTRDAVQGLNADLLCLQEIGGLPALEFLVPGAQHFAEHRLNPTAPARERRHGLGFAVSPTLKVERLPDLRLSEADGSDDYARDAVILKIEDQFLLVGLHLKSGCRDKLRLDKRAPCKILNAQVSLLCEWMSAQTLPLVLMGDFNRVLTQPRDTVWSQLKSVADLQILEAPYRQIDHILTPKNWAVELATPKGMQGYSDHRPLLLERL